MTDHQRFAGRVAVVTGASKGIGRAIAELLAAEGARVVMNARGASALREAAASLADAGYTVVPCPGSVLDEGVAESLAATAAERFGRVDVVVNTVGINTWQGPLLEMTERRFAKALVANTWPTVALVQAAIGHGLGAGGAVLAISSIGARQVQPLLAHYSASKAALEVVVRHLARELGPRGIRVNALAPGLVTTEMSEVLWAGPKAAAEASMLPLQRLGDPADIARAATFLVSADADWITGVTLDVDGGRLLMGGEPRELLGRFQAAEALRE